MSVRAPADEIEDRPSRTVATMTNPYAPPRGLRPGHRRPPRDGRSRRSRHAAGRGVPRRDHLLRDGLPAVDAHGVHPHAGGCGCRRRGTGNADTLLVIVGVLTLVGFGVWCWLTIKYMKRNGQSIAQEDPRHQGRPHRRLTRVARAARLAAQCRERAASASSRSTASSTCSSSSGNRGSVCTTRLPDTIVVKA